VAKTEVPAPVEKPLWQVAVESAEAKKAFDIKVLDLREVTTFTDRFIICSGSNPRQNQAISDEVHIQLKKLGDIPHSIEGYDTAEWILMDYGDYIVHVFSEKARGYYDLERLWRHGATVTPPGTETA
jgi:ribosome-associated protein